MNNKDVRDQLNDIETEVKEHTKILASVDKTLALQAQQLEQHMLRTQIAEENIEMLRQEFKPIQDQSKFIKSLMKLIAWVAAASAFFGGVISSIYYLLKILGKI